MRYLKVTLFLGLLSLCFAVVLYETGALHRLDLMWLAAEGVPLPGSDRLLQFALSALLAFGITWTSIDLERLWLKIVIPAAALLELLGALWIARLWGGVFSPFPGATAILLSLTLGLLYSRSAAGRRKNRLREIFGERISRGSFARLLNSDSPLEYEGEKREASVVVCEIFNHETLAEMLPVADYVAMHNSFLRNAADLMVERGGYLDECDGESLRVIFGTPLADENHAATAACAALALAQRLDAVNGECAKVWQQMFDFRIGINSGELVVATYGSARLGGFSVAGEPVEFAHRLCKANTIYGSGLLMSAATFGAVEALVEVRPMELIQRLPREHTREEVYELLALHGKLTEEERERRDLFWKGIVYFREHLWDEALNLFHSARRPDGSDGPVEFYLRRIEQIQATTAPAALPKPTPRLQ